MTTQNTTSDCHDSGNVWLENFHANIGPLIHVKEYDMAIEFSDSMGATPEDTAEYYHILVEQSYGNISDADRYKRIREFSMKMREKYDMDDYDSAEEGAEEYTARKISEPDEIDRMVFSGDEG